MLLPLQRMIERIERDKSESDTAAFYTLLHAGEFITKLSVLGLVGGIAPDRERHRERCLGQLVRADSIGDWIQQLDLLLLTRRITSGQLLIAVRSCADGEKA